MLIDFTVKPAKARLLGHTASGMPIFETPHECAEWVVADHKEAGARFERAHLVCRHSHLYAMACWHRDAALYGVSHPVTLKSAKKANDCFKQYLK